MPLKINDYVSTPNGKGMLLGNLRDKTREGSHLFLVAHKPGVVNNPTSGRKITSGNAKIWELWAYEEKEVKEL